MFKDSEISHDERRLASESIQMIAHRTMDHRTYKDLRRIVRQHGKTHYNDRLELWSTKTFNAMIEYLRSIEKAAA